MNVKQIRRMCTRVHYEVRVPRSNRKNDRGSREVLGGSSSSRLVYDWSGRSLTFILLC